MRAGRAPTPCETRKEPGDHPGLAELVLRDPPSRRRSPTPERGAALDVTGPQALRPFVVRGLVDAGRTVLAVTATVREAEDLTTELGDVLDPHDVAFYRRGRRCPRAAQSRSDTVGRRLAVLRRLGHPGEQPAPARSRSSSRRSAPCSSPRSRDGRPGSGGAGRGQEVALEAWWKGWPGRRTPGWTWSRSAGEFAVRGGIVDVFPPTEEHPLRVEFFGDEVDEIRSFAVADQRTLDKVDGCGASVP